MSGLEKFFNFVNNAQISGASFLLLIVRNYRLLTFYREIWGTLEILIITLRVRNPKKTVKFCRLPWLRNENSRTLGKIGIVCLFLPMSGYLVTYEAHYLIDPLLGTLVKSI